MHKSKITGAVIGLVVLGVSTGNALAKDVAFSADAVELNVSGQMQSGRLYVGALGTRMDYQQQGRPIVQVKLPEKNIMRIMFPLQRTYLEYKTPPGRGKAKSKSDAPCKPSAQLECKGPEFTTIGGISATLWKIKPKGARSETRVWWDLQRKMPLREEYVDGRVMQATMRGREKFEDRKVESWEFNFMAPNGTYQRTISLYAPDLGIAVVEKLPSGVIRRLHNITKGEPDAKLFEVPKGYKLIERPKPTASKPPRRMRQDQSNNGDQMPQTGPGARNNPAMWNSQAPGNGQVPNQVQGGQPQNGQTGNQFAGPGAPPRLWPGSGNARPGSNMRVWPGSGNSRSGPRAQNQSAAGDQTGVQSQ